MTWKPPAETDQTIRQWMKTHDFEVHSTHYDVDREIYAWRAEQERQSPTLRIARLALEYFPPEELTSWLDRLKVAEAMREHPHLVVRAKENQVVLDTITGAARRPPPRRKF